MQTLTRRNFMGVTGTLLASSVFASPKLAPCIAPLTTSKAAESVLIGIIDRTAPRTPSLNAALADVFFQACKPGARLVLWSFGGVGSNALPALVFDVRIPILAIPQNDLRHFAGKLLLSDKQSAAIETCALSYIKAIQVDLHQRVKWELAISEGSDPFGASPILSTINSALAPFNANLESTSAIKVVVATDGREHSGLLSFYPKTGEKLSVDDVVSKANRLYPAKWTGVRFHFAGLGISENGDMVLLEDMRQVWMKIIKQRGGLIGELSPSSLQKLE